MNLIVTCTDGRHAQCEHVIEWYMSGSRRTYTCECECHG